MSEINAVVGSETDMQEFKKLQQRLNHEAIRHQFKKKVVGGLDEDDVTKYIEDIESKFKKLEQEYKNATDETYLTKNKLNIELEEKDKLHAEIDQLKLDLKDYIEKSDKEQIDIKLRNESTKSENVLLRNELLQISNERNELKELFEKTAEEAKLLKESTVKFENENILLMKKTAELEHENNIIKLKLSDGEKDKEQILQYKDELAKSEEELKLLNEVLFETDREINHLKKYIAEFENEENVLKAKISELTEENKQISELKLANDQMTEDIKTFEELLSQGELEFKQLKESFEISKQKNIDIESKMAELENMILSKDFKISEINRVCQDYKQQLEIEKSCSDKLNVDLVIFKRKNISLEETVAEKLKELEAQRKSKEKAEQELSLEKARVLDYRINGFKDELGDVFKKLEYLQEESKQNLNSGTFLQQQLIIQQNRAEKAESDLQAFMQIIAGAKDKFYSERNLFGDQFKQLIEVEPQYEHVNENKINLK